MGKEQIFEDFKELKITASQLYYGYENDDVEFNKVIEASGVKLVQVNDYDEQVLDAVCDGYGSVPVSIVVEYQGCYFKSSGEYSSYGAENFGDWTPVSKIRKVIYIYE